MVSILAMRPRAEPAPARFVFVFGFRCGQDRSQYLSLRRCQNLGQNRALNQTPIIYSELIHRKHRWIPYHVGRN